MVALYKRLAGAGVDKAFLKKSRALPEWWDDEAALTPAGFSHGLRLIASHLGMEPASLREGQTPRFSREVAAPCYKLSASATPADVHLTTQIAIQAAVLALEALPQVQKALPTAAADIRAEIRARGVGTIDFRSLVDYCWSYGIPVIPLSDFPQKAKKMDGFAVRIGERFAIVLARKHAYPAWLIFTLAHEMAHICKGHLIGREVIADEDVYAEDTVKQEKEANIFALELLTGSPYKHFKLSGQYPSQLADDARRKARALQCDPGFVLLSHCYHVKQDWAKAQAALKSLESPIALKLLQRRLLERLDWGALNDETAEYLRNLIVLEGDDLA